MIKYIFFLLLSFVLMGAVDVEPNQTIQKSNGCDGAPAPTPSTPTPTPTPATGSRNFVDLVLAGYQGWFAAAGDGGLNSWSHWSGITPRAGQVTFELYPDVREYSGSDLFNTGLGNLGNGSRAQLYSSIRDGVIDTHFRWMSKYGIDGIALQRFLQETGNSPKGRVRNEITRKVKAYAEAHKKIFYITYDISGADERTLVKDIQEDWVNVLENTLHLTSSPQYARQDGRPVISLWGLGFHGRPGTTAQAQQLIQWFKKRGFYVIGGVPYTWRTENGASKPGWLSTYLQFNMIQPWTVGTMVTDVDVDNYRNGFIIPDKKLCDEHGVHYQSVMYPGFAWSNWNGGIKNMIPRRGGNLFWKQAHSLAGLTKGGFIAMFDEYDEGTAIAKAAENASMIPTNQYFLTLNADGHNLSSDFYLRLAGAATRMIQGSSPKTPTIPISPR